MTRLKFDPAGCMHPDWGITAKLCDSLRDPLIAIRDDLIAVADQSPQTSFLQLPWQQHSEYQQHREDSLLGKIFKVANSIHDEIDAVVVLGCESSTLAARALMQACCDPHHNELSRADRGSKPRMYFCENHLDSDSISALLNRLANKSNNPNVAADRWALIVIDDDHPQSGLAIVAEKFIAALRKSLGPDMTERISRYVIPITKQSGWLQNLIDEMACDVVIEQPESITDCYTALSAKTLLPAAMLGLDCMKLLGGAHQMTKHFAEADFSENMVLQFVAVNQLLRQKHGRTMHSTKPWSSALTGMTRWYESTFAELNFTSVSRISADQVIHQFAIQTPRCDPLIVGGEENQDMQELSAVAINEANRQWYDAGQPATKITLADSEFVAIGELFQFLMIASAVEASRL